MAAEPSPDLAFGRSSSISAPHPACAKRRVVQCACAITIAALLAFRAVPQNTSDMLASETLKERPTASWVRITARSLHEQDERSKHNWATEVGSQAAKESAQEEHFRVVATKEHAPKQSWPFSREQHHLQVLAGSTWRSDNCQRS